MTVTIQLPPEPETALREHAGGSGQDVEAFVLQAVQEKIARARTFDEVCAPFARAVDATGMSDEQFEQFFEGVREEVWQDKRQRTAP